MASNISNTPFALRLAPKDESSSVTPALALPKAGAAGVPEADVDAKKPRKGQGKGGKPTDGDGVVKKGKILDSKSNLMLGI